MIRYRKFEPTPADSRKSFYGKCALYVDDRGREALKSYRTIVMTRDETGQLHRHWAGWSMTTARHIKSTFDIDTKTYKKMRVEDLPEQWKELQYTF